MKTRVPFLVCLVLLASVPLTSHPCLAQTADSAGGTPAQRDYRAAHEAMRQKKWAEARQLLLSLWNKAKTYDVAASLSEVEYVLGDYPAAARYVAFAIASIVPNERPETVERLQAALKQVRAHVGTVHVSVNLEGADLRLDGESLGRSPLEGGVYVNPGSHDFEAQLGNETSRRTIDTAAGAEYRVHLELTPSAAPAESAQAPGSPPSSPVLTPKGEDESRGKSAVPIYVGAGITAVGLATWLGFGIAASSARDDVHARNAALGTSGCARPGTNVGACRALDEVYDRQRTRAHIANAGMGVTIVGAVATLGYVLFWPNEKKTSGTFPLNPSIALESGGGAAFLSSDF